MRLNVGIANSERNAGLMSDVGVSAPSSGAAEAPRATASPSPTSSCVHTLSAARCCHSPVAGGGGRRPPSMRECQIACAARSRGCARGRSPACRLYGGAHLTQPAGGLLRGRDCAERGAHLCQPAGCCCRMRSAPPAGTEREACPNGARTGWLLLRKRTALSHALRSARRRGRALAQRTPRSRLAGCCVDATALSGARTFVSRLAAAVECAPLRPPARSAGRALAQRTPLSRLAGHCADATALSGARTFVSRLAAAVECAPLRPPAGSAGRALAQLTAGRLLRGHGCAERDIRATRCRDVLPSTSAPAPCAHRLLRALLFIHPPTDPA
jgi:hypothetical protein